MKSATCLLACFIIGFVAHSQTYRTIKENTSITYTMRHPLHTWSGTSKEVNGLLQMDEKGTFQSVAIVTKIKSFDSDNSNRDAHMLEVTEALAHPLISFKSNDIRFNGIEQLVAKGTLSFHGKEKIIEVACQYQSTPKTLLVKGNFDFLLEDFDITPPSLMLMKTESKVRIQFSAAFGLTK